MKTRTCSSASIFVTFALLVPCVASAQVGPNQNAPNWWEIETEGQPVDFKIFWGPSSPIGNNCEAGYNCEWLASTADVAEDGQRIRIPIDYYAFTGPSGPGAETGYGKCGYTELNSDPNVPVNYYTTGGTKLTDATPIYPPDTMFNVSQPYSNAKGIVVYGSASGVATGATTAEADFYVSSNHCAAADTEWGFFKDMTADQVIQFYYYQYTNCGSSPSASLCRVPPYGPGTQVAQRNGSYVVNVTNVSAKTTNVYYSMYIIPAADSTYPIPPGDSYAFRLQILYENYNFATCTATWYLNGGYVKSSSGNCTADFPIDSWFPISNGAFSLPSYLFTGTYTVAGPSYVGPYYQLNGAWLGF
jgi:hypothetical protein